MTIRRLAVALILFVRLASLDTFPLAHPDEGGWPLAVRTWVETGQRSSDFYMAPGYHWLLGIPFHLFGAVHTVARPVSAVVSLLMLFLFYRLIQRLAGDSTALVATLFLGTSYPAVLIDRRALIEPFQITLIVALCLVMSPFLVPTVRPPRWWRYAAAAALTALLLLTKASGAFILPAIAIAVAWPWLQDGPRTEWKPRLGLAGALGCGVLVAAGTFWFLYLGDPHTFAEGWRTDMSAVNVPGTRPDGGGRFAIHPVSIERTIRWYSEYEPILFGLALLGLSKSLWERKHLLMASWLVLGAAFLFVQLYVQENHRAILLPALCFFAAHLLMELHAAHTGGRPGRSWAQAVVALTVLYSVARIGAGIARTTPQEAEAARWLAERTTAQSRIMAAPYVLMRLRAQPVSFWRLEPPFVPTVEQLARLRPDWLVVETEEWRSEHAKHHGQPGELEQALEHCCRVAFASRGATVYEVRKEVLARAGK